MNKMDSSSSASALGGGAVNIAPLRSLDDFMMSKARFQIPDVNNEERWLKRITQNLLFYQTNYFLSAAIIFGLVGFFHPQKIAGGMLVMVCRKIHEMSRKQEPPKIAKSTHIFHFSASCSVPLTTRASVSLNCTPSRAITLSSTRRPSSASATTSST
jgi:hypothetical protein